MSSNKLPAQESCYMCDEPNTSSEHVPPRCLFPEQKDLKPGEDLRRDLITVPSCEAHNPGKSVDDEFVWHIFMVAEGINAVGRSHVLSKFRRAVERRPALMTQILTDSSPALRQDDEGGFETLELKLDGARFASAMDKIGRGLYFHHFKKKWSGSCRIFPEFAEWPEDHEANQNASLARLTAEKLFSDVKAIGENPEVFSYKVAPSDQRESAIMRMNFYGGVKVTAVFN